MSLSHISLLLCSPICFQTLPHCLFYTSLPPAALPPLSAAATVSFDYSIILHCTAMTPNGYYIVMRVKGGQSGGLSEESLC